MLNRIFRPRSAVLLTSFRFRFGLIKFNLPDLGQKIKEGTIKKLYVKEGDAVEEFQKIADVASDKQFTEITASDSGVIRKIHYQEEDICQVGDLFLEIQSQEDGGTSSQATQKEQKKQDSQKQSAPQTSQKTSAPTSTEGGIATPFVRGLIKKFNLDISKIKGSGKDGRILEDDVHAFLSKKQIPEKSEPKKVQQPQKSEAKTSTSQSKIIQMNNFEKGMKKSMTQSNKIPHLYLHEEFDITETEKMRKTIKGNQTKVTLMGILIKTFSIALKKYPIINSTYQPEKNQFEYTIQGSHNISIAIDSPNGLVVPNIKDVQDCSLVKIQSELQRLRNLSAEAKLTGKELTQGTVCLSNIGTIGGVNACPLILPPQVCIVAIGKMMVVPKYIKDQLVPRTVITVSYGCDHRVIDGATVARFSNEWKKVLENPYLAMAEMY